MFTTTSSTGFKVPGPDPFRVPLRSSDPTTAPSRAVTAASINSYSESYTTLGSTSINPYIPSLAASRYSTDEASCVRVIVDLLAS